LSVIDVTSHAIHRAQDRFPDVFDGSGTREKVISEVASAFETGRVGKRHSQYGLKKHSDLSINATETLAWSEDGQRVYVVIVDPGFKRVITVLQKQARGECR
jgi:hypothetical protein